MPRHPFQNTDFHPAVFVPDFESTSCVEIRELFSINLLYSPHCPVPPRLFCHVARLTLSSISHLPSLKSYVFVFFFRKPCFFYTFSRYPTLRGQSSVTGGNFAWLYARLNRFMKPLSQTIQLHNITTPWGSFAHFQYIFQILDSFGDYF